MKKIGEAYEPDIVYFDVRTSHQHSFYLKDSTFICYDLNDSTLKRMNSKIQEKNEDGKIICKHIIYKINLEEIY